MSSLPIKPATIEPVEVFKVREQVLPGKRSTMFATDRIYQSEPARIRAWVAQAMDLLAAGRIAPIIGATLPLDQLGEAHRLLETGSVVGKIVIDCR